MSRHSHWAKIKRGKGATDAARGRTFSKLARTIAVASREGGADPAFNFKLRLEVDRAKSVSMPKDAIDRAIGRGAGTGADATAYETVLYEGFAPGGAAALIECLTDNRNRALAEVRLVFTKHGGTLGGEGSVRWQFQQRGMLRIAAPGSPLPPVSREEMELRIIEAGAEDIAPDAEEWVVMTKPENLQHIRDDVARRGFDVRDAALAWAPTQRVVIPEDHRARFDAFVDALDELDDVQEVYTNAEEDAADGHG